jgi:hypothetical protein
MHGWRSLNIELIPLDPDLERNFRRARRSSFEMGVNVRNEHGEEHEEYQDARARHVEQIRAYDMDFTASLRELFTPVATSSHSYIVLPPTNATHFDLKPHLIQLLPSFYGLDHENPYAHVNKFKNICATTKFQNFSEESVQLMISNVRVKEFVERGGNCILFLWKYQSQCLRIHPMGQKQQYTCIYFINIFQIHICK